MTTTLYSAGCIVAFQDGQHRILRDGCLVVEDDRISHVGTSFEGPVDRRVDLPDRIITPGVFVKRIIHVPDAAKHIEQRTVRKRTAPAGTGEEV